MLRTVPSGPKSLRLDAPAHPRPNSGCSGAVQDASLVVSAPIHPFAQRSEIELLVHPYASFRRGRANMREEETGMKNPSKSTLTDSHDADLSSVSRSQQCTTRVDPGSFTRVSITSVKEAVSSSPSGGTRFHLGDGRVLHQETHRSQGISLYRPNEFELDLHAAKSHLTKQASPRSSTVKSLAEQPETRAVSRISNGQELELEGLKLPGAVRIPGVDSDPSCADAEGCTDDYGENEYECEGGSERVSSLASFQTDMTSYNSSTPDEEVRGKPIEDQSTKNSEQERDPQSSGCRLRKGVVLSAMIVLVAPLMIVVFLMMRRKMADDVGILKKSGSLLSICDNNDDCITPSSTCHFGRCRSGIDEPICERLDVCRRSDCSEGCLDANHFDACTLDDDCDSNVCRSGTCLSGEVGTFCVFSSDCLTGLCLGNLCARKLDIGFACSVDEECQSASCPDSICTAGDFGDTCVSSHHCQSSHCVDGRCGPSDVGGWCSEDSGCFSSFCHTTLNVCEPKGASGMTCTEDNHCESGVCVLHTCSDGRTGSLCKLNAHCQSGLCTFDECKATPAGSSCEEDSGCKSGSCVNNTCSAPVDLGSRCSTDEGCVSGFCDMSDPDAEKGTCTEQREVGDKCERNSSCKSALCSSEPSACIERLREGDRCELNDEEWPLIHGCADGLFCTPDSGICEKSPGIGSRCFGGIAGACSEGICDPTTFICSDPLSDGLECVLDLQCKSRNCDGDICQAPLFE